MPVASMASECHSAAGPISGILGFARTASKCGRQENGVTARGRRMPRALMDLSAGQRQCILCSSHYSHYGNTCRGTRARVTILTNLDTRHRHTAIRRPQVYLHSTKGALKVPSAQSSASNIRGHVALHLGW
jgi:hypothetical protein